MPGGRECRTAAARSVREKLSKPSDIASLMRVQERLSQSQLVPTEWGAGFQKVVHFPLLRIVIRTCSESSANR